jgi:hypothetical protein
VELRGPWEELDDDASSAHLVERLALREQLDDLTHSPLLIGRRVQPRNP